MSRLSGGELLHTRHQFGTWSELGDAARHEATRLLALLELENRPDLIELLLVGATLAAYDNVTATGSVTWVVDTDLGRSNVRMIDEDTLACEVCQTLRLSCHHVAAVRLWASKQPADLTELMTRLGWLNRLSEEFDWAPAVFEDLLSDRQRSMVCRWIQFGGFNTMLSVLEGLRLYTSGQATWLGASRYEVEHGSNEHRPVDLTEPSGGCSCDRRQGQGEYENRAGLCAGQVAAALMAAQQTGVLSLV